jgi:hypothetical protein
MKRILLSAVVLGLSVFTLYAQAPKTEGQVPVYPGAKLVSEQQSPTKAELASGTAPTFAFSLERTYSSPASVEQIAQFYAAKLKAGFDQEGGADPNDLAPGEVSSVGSGVEYYDGDFIDQSPDAVKAAFEKRAQLPDSDAWAHAVSFTWAFKNAGKDPYSFALTITDKSLVPEDEPTAYKQASEITLAVSMLNHEKADAFQADMIAKATAAQQASAPSKEQIQEAQAQAQKAAEAQKAAAAKADAESARVQAEFAKVPTEKDLGVAVYPGARYSPEQSMFQSAFMTDGLRVYIFEANAKPDVLCQFYEKRTGNKNSSPVPTMMIVAISFGKAAQKGDNPPMKDYVTIAGPTDAGTSLLMFTKRPASWTGLEGGGR